MPNLVDTTNDLDRVASQTPFSELYAKLEHGEGLELGGKEWSSLIGYCRKQTNDRSLRFLSTQDDRVGELVGEGLAGRSVVLSINISDDRITVPQQMGTWVLIPSKLILSDENSFPIAATSYHDYRKTAAGWIGRQIAEPSKEDGVENPWDANATLESLLGGSMVSRTGQPQQTFTLASRPVALRG